MSKKKRKNKKKNPMGTWWTAMVTHIKGSAKAYDRNKQKSELRKHGDSDTEQT